MRYIIILFMPMINPTILYAQPVKIREYYARRGMFWEVLRYDPKFSVKVCLWEYVNDFEKDLKLGNGTGLNKMHELREFAKSLEEVMDCELPLRTKPTTLLGTNWHYYKKQIIWDKLHKGWKKHKMWENLKTLQF